MISIIIPTYNEGETISSFLDSIINKCKECEIIIVDATGCSLTKEVADQQGVKFIQSEKGRAKQMNYGAKNASSDILYFLHADSIPPDHFDSLIEQEVNSGNEAGCFYMGFDSNHLVLKVSGWFTRFNSDWCRGGDQSLFITKPLFDKIEGFNESLTILEDNEIIPRIKSESRFVVIQEKLVTSARRYRENGVVRLQFLFGIIHFGYRLGWSESKLLKFYQRHVI